MAAHRSSTAAPTDLNIVISVSAVRPATCATQRSRAVTSPSTPFPAVFLGTGVGRDTRTRATHLSCQQLAHLSDDVLGRDGPLRERRHLDDHHIWVQVEIMGPIIIRTD
jgi:hypothetical protein